MEMIVMLENAILKCAFKQALLSGRLYNLFTHVESNPEPFKAGGSYIWTLHLWVKSLAQRSQVTSVFLDW